MTTEIEGECEESEEAIEPWQPSEPKAFYWLFEVAKFLGVSRTNIHFKMRRGDLRARMFRQGGRHGWVVAHDEMVRYMREGSWRLSKFPIVEDRVRLAEEPTEGLSIPDPMPRRRDGGGEVVPPGSREALKRWIRQSPSTSHGGS